MSPSAAYLDRLVDIIGKVDREELDGAIAAIRRAWLSGNQVITLGNGGSAMTALHFVTDWGKMIYLASGRPLRARTLVDNIGLITAYSNDLSYADVFAEQLKNVAQPGDLVVAVSGSGNSENVVRAVAYANEAGCDTLGLCGFSGGRLKELARFAVWVRSDDMQLCEDLHAVFGHIVMQTLCAEGKTSCGKHS
jgi:D-sedoheptulose 7-phosphate isomerase